MRSFGGRISPNILYRCLLFSGSFFELAPGLHSGSSRHDVDRNSPLTCKLWCVASVFRAKLREINQSLCLHTDSGSQEVPPLHSLGPVKIRAGP